MNLLHVVSCRSLHVAFQSSRTLPENRNPAATRYVPRHTWQNGRAQPNRDEGTRESLTDREEGGKEESYQAAMMP